MCSRTLTQPSTASCCAQAEAVRQALSGADAIVVGAGAGLSASAGLTYDGERFSRCFGDFAEKYGIQDMYTGGFYPFPSQEEYWAWWSRHIMANRYQTAPKPVYDTLLKLLKGRDYFVLTTNVDHQFQLAGFDKERLFYTQGDYGLWQCAEPCCQRTYDNEVPVRRMAAEQRDMRIPSALLPRCPRCGGPMTMNLRVDSRFVQDEGWYRACERYRTFLRRHEGLRVVYWELGVGGNTPAIIKWPFQRRTYDEANTVYICVNSCEASAPRELGDRAICVREDIGAFLQRLL